MIEELQTVVLIELAIVLLMYIITWVSSLFYEETVEAKAVLSYDEFKELLKNKEDD